MKNKFILLIQALIFIFFTLLWEFLSRYNIINSFIFSSPIKIIICISNLFKNNNLVYHIYITLKEIIVSFSLSIILSFLISLLFYNYKILYKISEPFLTIINSIPKVSIGPLIIILFGANNNSIIIMALSITLIVNILTFYNGFINVDKNLLKVLEIYNATKKDKLKYLVIPSAISNIISGLKINISLTLIGVIMGEFLVSKAGIGYLIIYGSQVFNLTIVMSGILILIIISCLLYLLIKYIEKYFKNKTHILY